MIEYLKAHEIYIWWLTAISVCTFAGTLIAVPWLIVHLPADYFSHRSRHTAAPAEKPPLPKNAILVAKNLLGLAFVIAGIVMLLIPGQGLLTIGVGLILLDFPGKYTIERWAVRRGPVLRHINRIRQRAQKPPLVMPAPGDCVAIPKNRHSG